MCYAHDSKRTPKTTLLLHNLTFLHALQCSSLFASPKTITRRKMFGRYFHTLVSHAALMFRMVSLRSLNTEQHEKFFQQAKGITKGTTPIITHSTVSPMSFTGFSLKKTKTALLYKRPRLHPWLELFIQYKTLSSPKTC